MKKVLALTAGVLVALAPSGTAFAGEHESVPGKAYGNCGHSSAGGKHHTGLLRPDYNNGNGGLVELAKSGKGCLTTSTGLDGGLDPVEPETPVGEVPTKPAPPAAPTAPR